MICFGSCGTCPMQIPCHYAMSAEGERRFVAETTALKAQYADIMDIFCGIELDYYSMPVNQPYHYRIGSLHYLPCGEGYLSVDSNAETLLYQFSESIALARACGFSSIWTLTKNGSCEIPL